MVAMLLLVAVALDFMAPSLHWICTSSTAVAIAAVCAVVALEVVCVVAA